jgi:hypothetical protein
MSDEDYVPNYDDYVQRIERDRLAQITKALDEAKKQKAEDDHFRIATELLARHEGPDVTSSAEMLVERAIAHALLGQRRD